MSALKKISDKFGHLDDWHHVNKFSLVLIVVIFAAIPLTVFTAITARQLDSQAFYNPRCSLFRYGQSTPVSKDVAFKSGDKAFIYYADFLAGGKARLRDRLYGGIHQELGTTQEKLFTTGRLDFTFKSGLPNGLYSVVINPSNASSTNIKCADIKLAGNIPPKDTTPPSTPLIKTSNITSSSITWSWSSTDNIGVTSYSHCFYGNQIVYKDVVPDAPTSGGSAAGCGPADQKTSVVASDLLDEWQYSMTVTAFDAAGNKSPSVTSAVKTLKKDNDNDGFGNNIEIRIGTNPNLACGSSAWPPDFDNSKSITSNDQLSIVRYINTSHDNSQTPNQSGNYYKVRYDLNYDGKVDVTDQQILASYFSKTCA